MAKSKPRPKSRSVDDLVDFFDHHDMSDLIDEMEEVDVEVGALHHRHLVELEDDVVSRLDETARARKMSSSDLVNLFLREKLAGVS